MKRTIIIVLLAFALTSFSKNEEAHEFYLSVTEVVYKKDQKALQITSRVFTDDMQRVLNTRYDKNIKLSYEKDLKANKSLFQKYLEQKLKITVGNKQISLTYLGCKFDADQLVLFLEAENVKDFSTVEVENLVLTDLFDDQKNIVHVQKADETKSALLNKENGSEIFYF